LAWGVSLQVNDAIMRALAKRPSQRFATAGEFIFALDGSQPEPVSDLPEESPAARNPRTRSLTFPRIRARPRLPRLSPRVGTALGIGCLCAVGALTLFSLRKKIAVPHIAPAFAGALNNFSVPVQTIDRWIGRTRLDTVESQPDSEASAAPSPRVTSSGVAVENGVLVFPGERGAATAPALHESSSRRGPAARDLASKAPPH
jgi:hypothetical protein